MSDNRFENLLHGLPRTKRGARTSKEYWRGADDGERGTPMMRLSVQYLLGYIDGINMAYLNADRDDTIE
jgi:hypothetical protein